MKHICKWLYKYGAFLLWIMIAGVYVLTNDIWLSVSVILISLIVGVTYADFYTGHIKTSHQKIKLIENDCCVLILSIILLCKNWKIIICTIVILGIYHMCRRNIISTMRHVCHIIKHIAFIIHMPHKK